MLVCGGHCVLIRTQTSMRAHLWRSSTSRPCRAETQIFFGNGNWCCINYFFAKFKSRCLPGDRITNTSIYFNSISPSNLRFSPLCFQSLSGQCCKGFVFVFQPQLTTRFRPGGLLYAIENAAMFFPILSQQASRQTGEVQRSRAAAVSICTFVLVVKQVN